MPTSKTRYLLIFFLAPWLCSTSLHAAPASSHPRQPSQLAQEGKTCTQGGKYGKAQSTFDDLIKILQKDTPAEAAIVAMEAGDLFFKERRYAESIAIHRKGAALLAEANEAAGTANKAFAASFILALGDRYFHERQYTKAIALYRIVGRWAGRDISRRAAIRTGLAYGKIGRYIRALATYRWHLRRYGDPTGQINFYVALTLLEANQKTKALRILEKEIELHPSSPWADDALFYSAITLLYKGRANEAKKLLENLVRDHPNSKLVKRAQKTRGGK